MPTYDYKCKACGHEFELYQSMTESSKRKCPACGKNALERLIGTGAAVLFKGSGFYQTDYRSESYKSAAKADQEAAKPSAPAATDTNGTNGTTKSETTKSEKGKKPKSGG